MQNITFPEWDVEIAKVAEQLQARWPWMRVEASNLTLNLATPSCSGAVTLRSVMGERFLEGRPTVDSSSCLQSDTRIARAQLMDGLAICDALDVALSMLGRLHVWGDGACPCDRCSGRGKSRGSKCEGCDGKGVR